VRVLDSLTGFSGKNLWPLILRLRLATGLVLFAFAATHFLNHAMGLISINAMDIVRDGRIFITRSHIGTVILASSLILHFAIGIASILRRKTWRLSPRDWLQIGFGLLIPVFLLTHVIGMRFSHELFGLDDDYEFALWSLWPNSAIAMTLLLLAVWIHGCIGIYHWLSVKPFYRQWRFALEALAILIPALGLAGFASAGRALHAEGIAHPSLTDAQRAAIRSIIDVADMGYDLVLVILGIAVLLLILYRRSAKRIRIVYTNGPVVSSPLGLSLLEVSRLHNIPHASVCGGRARCSTCRVRVLEGLDRQEPPAENEVKVLKRVGAPPNVRLACQLRPQSDLRITLLLPATAALARLPNDKYLWGVEQQVTVLFCDLRGFTRLSANRLSYDTVFLLNQFLARMSEVIEDSGGYIDKFMGDGIMAIFGMDRTAAEGAQAAIAAARAMAGVLDALNQSLHEELPAPLDIAIGLNSGPAILGRIGAAGGGDVAARVTALGQTVNIASRLEGIAKDLGVQAVLSRRTAETAGIALSDRLEQRDVDVRGLGKPLPVVIARKAAELAAQSAV
jgi:adenylate cyclase